MLRSLGILVTIGIVASATVAQDKPDDSRNRPKPAVRKQRVIEVKDPSEFAKLQDKPLFSGPQPGEAIPSFTATNVRDGEALDPAAKIGDDPHVLVFQDENGSGLRGLIGLSRIVSQIAAKADVPLGMTAVLLDDDATRMTDVAKRLLPHASKELNLAVSSDGRDGPGAYGLNRNLSMTILMVKQGKVVHNFVLAQGMLGPDPHVLGGLADLIDVDREVMQQWANESQRDRDMMRTRRQ